MVVMIMSSIINKKTYRAFFVCVLTFVVYLILHNAHWTFNDDFQFLESTAINKLIVAFSGSGRYWPLGLFDYNILLLIPYGYTIEAHLIHNIVIMILSFFVLSNLLGKITENNYCINLFGLLFLIISKGFFYTHMTCVCSERMMMFCFILFMYFYWKGWKLQSTKHYCLAVLSIIYATYLKEPVFGMIAVLALMNLIFQNKALTRKDKLFNYALLVNSCVYFAVYVYQWQINSTQTSSLYGTPGLLLNNNLPRFINDFFINDDPLLILLWIGALVRLYCFFIKKDREHVFFDGLLFSSVSYSGVYFLLGFRAMNYRFPSIVLSTPVLVYWIYYCYKYKSKKIYNIIVFLITIIMIWNGKQTYKEICRTLKIRVYDSQIAESMAKNYLAKNRIVYLENDDMQSLEYIRITCPIVVRYILNLNKAEIIISPIKFDDIINTDIIITSNKLPNKTKKALLDAGFVKTNTSLRSIFIYQHKKYIS